MADLTLVVGSVETDEVEPLPRCYYCGWPTLRGNTTCYAHSDLPAHDPHSPYYRPSPEAA